MRKHFTQFVLMMCGLAYVLPAAAHATTFVLMDESALLHTSTAVVIGTVTAIESAAPDPNGPIYTYIHIQPQRVLKGRLNRRRPLVLRELGGNVGERRQWIFGAPEFWVGERDLLFLSRNADGTLQTTNLSMGKFTLAVGADGHTQAVRNFGYGAAVLVPGDGQILEAQPQTQRFVPLVGRLRTLAQQEPADPQAAPLTLEPAELATTPTMVHDAFVFLSSPPARWFQPDSGQPVNYVVDSAGDATLGFTTSRAAVDAAMAVWTNLPTSSLILADTGTANCSTPSNCSFAPCDANRIVFNDPNNEITDPSGCAGILAIGGYCNNGNTTVVNGTTFDQIVVGKVMFNNGWGGCSFWNQCNVSEVMTHELGHSIGLGHSTDPNATMWATAHFDGRCAGLGTDDVAAANFIYPQSGTPLPTGTFTPSVTTTPTRTVTNTSPPTSTPTITPTATVTPTFTPTRTASQTPTVTATFTPGPPTATSTQTVPPTPTRTPVPTATGTDDTCGGATVITTTPYNTIVTTTAATTDSNDPAPGCGNGSRGHNVWFRFTAPSNGTLTANTFGSSYDTILATFTGSCGAFSSVSGGCNDDAAGTLQSQVSFTATAGTTYYFMPTAYSGGGGSLHFQLTFQGVGNTATPTATWTPRPPTATFTPAPPPATFTQTSPPTATFTAGPPTATFTFAPPTSTFTPAPPTPTFTHAAPTATSPASNNDFCTGATVVTGTSYTTTMSTTTATIDTTVATGDPSPSCGNRSRSRSVWYRFTAPSSGTVTVNTLGSSYDTILSAYTGMCGAFTPVTNGCDDDVTPSIPQSQVSFAVTAGRTYYFMVTSYTGAGGTLHFQLTF